ncbi:hypothetical protein Scep_000466 [Stephania cephalantha]|uniref:mitogen-activated protein kinase kinase kinase n=1 Tax=Stephania cephalantha TaxID=152367 RepID=A0AAP0L772_9MAGN
MRWLPSPFSSSSPPSSSSPSSSTPSPKSPVESAPKRNLKDANYLFRIHRALSSNAQQQPQPRLTRQRKLRHLTDLEVWRSPLVGQVQVSGNSTPASSASPGTARSSSAKPQPLPLPELAAFVRRDSGNAALSSGDLPLPSPRDGSGRSEAEGEGLVGDGVPPSSPRRRRSIFWTTEKNTERIDICNSKSPIDRGKTALRDLYSVDNDLDFQLNAPPRSAPATGFSSPMLSPRRMSSGSFFSSPYLASQGVPAWSAREMPSVDMLTGLSSHASPDKVLSSPEHSPLHSPRQNPRSPRGGASPMHPKLAMDSTTAWPDSNGLVAVHPLPLPPGAASPSLPTLGPLTVIKPDLSPKIGQWHKQKLIGSGTFGSVYVATNSETGALCAMKEVNLIPDDPKSAECIKQLEQEIKVLSQLKHPNIVQYYGSEIVDNHFYIYLEYVHPGSINKYVREHCGAMTESVVRSFTRHILHGLAYLHSTKTIHRDIKGANLLVDASGVVKLADFGMAKHLGACSADLSMKGTPHWMAPEVIQSVMQKDASRDVALAVDIWSLGCTIIEMLTGKPPWSEFEGAAAMFKVMKESPPIPESLSSAGKEFLQCCFQRNPAKRPSASTLLEHRFLRSSHQAEGLACTRPFSGMRIMDFTHSPRERTKHKVDLTPFSSGGQTMIGRLSSHSHSETGQQPHTETSNAAASSRHSPRSTLEALPSLSPPHSKHSTHVSKFPSNAADDLHLSSRNSRINGTQHLFLT